MNNSSEQFQALDSVLSDVDNGTQTAPATPVQDPIPEPTQEPSPEPSVVPTTPAPTIDTESIFAAGSPSNKAFAEMRVQNKQLQAVVNQLAKAYNLPAESIEPNKLVPMIQERLLAEEAKANNIPEDLAKRLAEADRIVEEVTAMQRNQIATLGFQKVKNDYKLDDASLEEFARALDAKGMNPYVSDIDLVEQYRQIYFDRIMEQTRKQALEEAKALSIKAANQSSTPTKAVGAPSEDPAPINTVDGLNRWLSRTLPK